MKTYIVKMSDEWNCDFIYATKTAQKAAQIVANYFNEEHYDFSYEAKNIEKEILEREKENCAYCWVDTNPEYEHIGMCIIATKII